MTYHKEHIEGLPPSIFIRCKACNKRVRAHYHHAREYTPHHIMAADPYYLTSYLIPEHSIGLLKPKCRASNRMIHRRYSVKWSAGRPIGLTSYKKRV